MSLTISNIFLCPKPHFNHATLKPKTSYLSLRTPFLRFSSKNRWSNSDKIKLVVIRAASSTFPDSDSNPYEVLGVSPIESFEKIKKVYAKKMKEAERDRDDETAARLEKAYDKLMMSQLSNRKKGVTFGSFKVSKEVKYADKQPIVPWGPRYTKSSMHDMRINLAISAFFTAWIVFKRSAEYRPLQFLAFAFVYRIFEKLRVHEPPVTSVYTEFGEDVGRTTRMGKRLVRCLGLVFGCIALSSLAYTGTLNLVEYTRDYIPAILYNSQELIITTASAVLLFFMASYYR